MSGERRKIELALRRDGDTGKSTYGTLFVDDAFRAYTLEDSGRQGHGKGASAPPGRYRVTWEPSNRLKRNTLRLKDVPGRNGILIHSGNTSVDCSGCILLGRVRESGDSIGASQVAVSSLENWIVPKLQAGAECWITIEERP